MSGDHWKMKTSSGLTRPQQTELKQFLQAADTNIWLCGAISVGRCRWRNIAVGKLDLPGLRLYLYPLPVLTAAILVGADELQGAASGVWRVLSGSLAAKYPPTVELHSGPAASGRSSSRTLRLIQQVQNCAAKSASTAGMLEEATRLISAYFPDGQVEITAVLGTERFAPSLGNHPGDGILILATLTRGKAVYGGISITLPPARHVSSTDYMLIDIVAAILSAELAVVLPTRSKPAKTQPGG